MSQDQRDQSNAIFIYRNVADPLQFIREQGKEIAKSTMAGRISESQGVMIAWDAFSRGRGVLSLFEQYDVIHGKLSMKADAMLSKFRAELGGKHIEIEKSPDRAAIRLIAKDGETKDYELLWDKGPMPFCKEPTPYQTPKQARGDDENGEQRIIDYIAEGKPLSFKSKYATPRSRANMMWKRLISDSLRSFCPECVNGVYTPEEIEDIPGMTTVENGNGTAIDAEFEPVTVTEATDFPTPTPETTATTTTTTSSNGNGDDHPTGPGGYATVEQTMQLSDLLAKFGKQTLVVKEKVLSTCGVTELRAIPSDTASSVIAKLQAMLAKQQTSEPQTSTPTPETVHTGESQQSPDANTADVNGPCSQVQIDRIKSLIDEITPFDAAIAQKILTAIKPCTGISQLTWAAAQKITKSLDDKLRKHTVSKTLDGGANGTNGAGNAEEATATTEEATTVGK